MKSVIVLVLWVGSVVAPTPNVNSIKVRLNFIAMEREEKDSIPATASLSVDQNLLRQVTPDKSQNVPATTIWIIIPWRTLKDKCPKDLRNIEKLEIGCENNGTAFVDGASRKIEAVTLKSCFLVEQSKVQHAKGQENADRVGMLKTHLGKEFIVMKMPEGKSIPSDRHTRFGFISFSVVQKKYD